MDRKTSVLLKFGRKIRKIRIDKGLTQEQLGFKCNLHRTYIGMIERGEKNITLLNIEKIANALNISVCILFEDDNGK